MGKVDHRRLAPSERHHSVLLKSAFGKFQLNLEGKQFLLHLLTPSEVVMLARRLEVARRLLLGWSFDRIKHDLHVGLDNILCVDIWLNRRLPDYRATPWKILRIEDAEQRTVQLCAWLHKNFPKDASFITTLIRNPSELIQ